MAFVKRYDISYKYLSSVNLGGTDVRYLSVVDGSSVRFPDSLTQFEGRILFLASDVLLGTSVARKNNIRIHSRYAKDGFATKLSLEGFKVEGINNSGTMWFYSVQGLFQVAFELHTPDTQRDCLLQLKELWLRGYNDAPLQQTGVIHYNTLEADDKSNLTPVIAQVMSGMTETAGHERHDRLGTEGPGLDTSGVTGSAASCPLQETMYILSNQKPVNVEKSSASSGCHDNRSLERDKDLEAGDFVEQLISFVRRSISDVGEISHQIIYQILLTLDYLKYISSSDSDHFTEWGLTFFDMMESFLSAVKGDMSDASYEDTYGISRDRYVLLYVVSEWVGKEFHKLESEVSLRVENFKKQNISSIDNLPPSEATVDMLYPSCMKQLLVNWMGMAEEQSGSKVFASQAAIADHDYSPPCKLKRECSSLYPGSPSKPFYPIIQLILEFATNSLVSGVAHVVYTRLRHTA